MKPARPLSRRISRGTTFLFSFLSVLILASFLVAIPGVVRPVNAQVISDDWKNYLESYLFEVDTNTTAELVIYVVDSLYLLFNGCR